MIVACPGNAFSASCSAQRLERRRRAARASRILDVGVSVVADARAVSSALGVSFAA